MKTSVQEHYHFVQWLYNFLVVLVMKYMIELMRLNMMIDCIFIPVVLITLYILSVLLSCLGSTAHNSTVGR